MPERGVAVDLGVIPDPGLPPHGLSRLHLWLDAAAVLTAHRERDRGLARGVEPSLGDDQSYNRKGVLFVPGTRNLPSGQRGLVSDVVGSARAPRRVHQHPVLAAHAQPERRQMPDPLAQAAHLQLHADTGCGEQLRSAANLTPEEHSSEVQVHPVRLGRPELPSEDESGHNVAK